MGGDITLRFFEGCPNWQIAKERIEHALVDLGQSRTLRLERVETPAQADEVGFRGSPTVLIDGRDPFPATGPTGLSCRIYRTDDGMEGAPSIDQLIAAFRETR